MKDRTFRDVSAELVSEIVLIRLRNAPFVDEDARTKGNPARVRSLAAEATEKATIPREREFVRHLLAKFEKDEARNQK
jgi:hypothetical protein